MKQLDKFNTPLTDKEKLEEIHTSVDRMIEMIDKSPLAHHQLAYDLEYISMLSSGIVVWHTH